MSAEIIPFDRRQITSPENGQLGGRPKIDVLGIAEEFSQKFKVNGKWTIRFYKGTFHQYIKGHWRKIDRSDLEHELMAFIQDNYPDQKPTRNLLRDVIENLLSFNYFSLPSAYEMPFWSDGTSAKDWVVMGNAIVNIEALAQAERIDRDNSRDAVRPQTPDLFTTIGLPYDYNPEAQCPHWMRYLERVQPNPENRRIIQLMFALALVPDTRYEVAFILFGEGGTGKSVLLHVLTHLVGVENVCNIPLSRFGSRFGLDGLTTCLLNIVGDMPTAGDFTSIGTIEGAFKDVCSGGMIPVERKFENLYMARAIARNIFATNSLPPFSDSSNAIWSRLRIIPFNEMIRGTGEDNKNLKNELLEELPGIFNWAVAGLKELRTLPLFPECPEGEALKAAHREDCDHEGTFLRDLYTYDPTRYCTTMEVYQHYRIWMASNGYRHAGMARFSSTVKRVFPKVFKDKTGADDRRVHVWSGVTTIRRTLWPIQKPSAEET